MTISNGKIRCEIIEKKEMNTGKWQRYVVSSHISFSQYCIMLKYIVFFFFEYFWSKKLVFNLNSSKHLKHYNLHVFLLLLLQFIDLDFVCEINSKLKKWIAERWSQLRSNFLYVKCKEIYHHIFRPHAKV